VKLNSRAIALILAICVGLLTGAFLGLIEDLPVAGIVVGISIAFSSTFLLSYFVLEFLFFREIQEIYKLLDSIQGKSNPLDRLNQAKGEGNPFKRINAEIEQFASSKQQEIEYLKQLGAFRREFLADVSHELKTPIFSAQGYIYTLLDGAIDDKNVRHKFLKKAARSLDGLDRLVADLITVSQMETGAVTMDKELFDIRGLAYEVRDQLNRKAEKRGATIEIRHEAKTPVFVKGDKRRLGQVFNNLIDNALKYGKPEKGRIVISFQTMAGQIEVKIKDDGPGIPPEHLNRVFERFYMVDRSRAKTGGKKGSGLGLAIVKHIIEAHGGNVEVSSKLGVGTVFCFKLEKGRLRNKESAKEEKGRESS
jgi:two-component system, OmpR family, phosphate regulon sensor histidine kinase PhoR